MNRASGNSHGKDVQSVTNITLKSGRGHEIHTKAFHKPSAHLEAGPMFWHKAGHFAADCLAVSTGLLIAAPFFMVITAPFLLGF